MQRYSYQTDLIKMCGTTRDGYKLNNGNIVNAEPYLNLNDIPESVKKELEKSNATQLDLLLVRSDLAVNRAEAKKVKSLAIANRDKINLIDQKFYVTIRNGKDEKKHISDLILEIYERETNRRHLGYFFNLISRHKKLIYFIIISFLLINLGFHKYISEFFRWVSEHFLDILKLIF